RATVNIYRNNYAVSLLYVSVMRHTRQKRLTQIRWRYSLHSLTYSILVSATRNHAKEVSLCCVGCFASTFVHFVRGALPPYAHLATIFPRSSSWPFPRGPNGPHQQSGQHLRTR